MAEQATPLGDTGMIGALTGASFSSPTARPEAVVARLAEAVLLAST
ncbi:hypothetical protein [Amycolatopsis sp. GA6-003]